MAPITFTLPPPYPLVEVSLPSELCSQVQLLSFRPFKEWLETFRQSVSLQSQRQHIFHARDERYSLRSIEIQSVDFFGPRIGFVKMKTVVTNTKDPKPLAGIVFLRGGSVAVLMIIQKEGSNDRHVVMTQQPRIPAGSLSFYEIPAGMIDDEGTFTGAAAKELFEETGLRIPARELIDMTVLALERSEIPESHLQKAMYPSPGGCDEFISLMLWKRTMSPMEINEMNGKIRGVDSEHIKTKLVKYDDLWREGARDAKTLAALALYEGLTRDGTLANV